MHCSEQSFASKNALALFLPQTWYTSFFSIRFEIKNNFVFFFALQGDDISPL